MRITVWLAVAGVLMIVSAAAFIGARSYASASHVTAADADIDWNGYVGFGDLLGLASYYNQQVPPGARPVAEQNLDANGNIKVHEQGVVSVQVQMNPGTSTVILDTDHSGGVAYTNFANVESCDEKMILMADRSDSLYFDNRLAYVASPDGATGYGIPLGAPPIIDPGTPGYTEWVSAATSRAYLDVTGHSLGPYMQFGIPSGAQHLTIRLYCR